VRGSLCRVSATGAIHRLGTARRRLIFWWRGWCRRMRGIVIPVEAFAPRKHLWLYPRGEHAGQYEKYREAWELLGAAVKVE
jgi:hypothetical protein